MKKLLVVALAVLFLAGSAEAANIPSSIDAKNVPEIWITEVYSNKSSAITSGSVVIWDFDNSDVSENQYDDRCNWVTTTVTASDPWTAGVVVSDSLAAYDTGFICIRGVVPVLTSTPAALTTPTEDDMVGTTTTAGWAAEISEDTGDLAILGVCVKDSTHDTSYFTYGGGTNISLIFVDPTLTYRSD